MDSFRIADRPELFRSIRGYSFVMLLRVPRDRVRVPVR
jgi:hypothetical protein